MKKALQKIQNELYHYFNGKKSLGQNKNMSGDCSGLRGNCTGLRGECTDLYGDLRECEITDEERKKGIDIKDLIKS